MASGMPLEVANLLGLMVAMVMYGVYLVMFLGTIDELWIRRKRSAFVFYITLCLFVATTGNVVLFNVDTYNAWVKYRSIGTNNYFSSYWTIIVPLKYLFAFMAGFTADILMCWRLYIVWSRNRKVIIVPALLLIIDFFSTIFIVVVGFLGYNSAGCYNSMYVIAGVISGSCAAIMNVTATSLIVGKLWSASRVSGNHEGRSLYKRIIVTLIESGTLYTGLMVVWIVMIVIPDGYGAYCFLNRILIMVTAISPMLIVLRLNEAHKEQVRTQTDVEFVHRNTNSVSSVPPRIVFGRIETGVWSAEGEDGGEGVDVKSSPCITATLRASFQSESQSSPPA
ncbi:hypothetical protein FRB96_008408 [Tulasnella sp. 330]|nr:hypothetical protein FRB96_008408 [Tulasnella sp. 330]KAG8886929.1 hypothetical protein FRB98_000757 [Tulasnella sp. 332]